MEKNYSEKEIQAILQEWERTSDERMRQTEKEIQEIKDARRKESEMVEKMTDKERKEYVWQQYQQVNSSSKGIKTKELKIRKKDGDKKQ